MFTKQGLDEYLSNCGVYQANQIINYGITLAAMMMSKRTNLNSGNSPYNEATKYGYGYLQKDSANQYRIEIAKAFNNNETTGERPDLCINVKKGLCCHKSVVVPSVDKRTSTRKPIGSYCSTHMRDNLIVKKRGISTPYNTMKSMLKVKSTTTNVIKDAAQIYPVKMKGLKNPGDPSNTHYFVLLAKSAEYAEINGVIARMRIINHEVIVDIIGKTDYTKIVKDKDELRVDHVDGLDTNSSSSQYKLISKFKVRILDKADREFKAMHDGTVTTTLASDLKNSKKSSSRSSVKNSRSVSNSSNQRSRREETSNRAMSPSDEIEPKRSTRSSSKNSSYGKTYENDNRKNFHKVREITQDDEDEEENDDDEEDDVMRDGQPDINVYNDRTDDNDSDKSSDDDDE